MALNKIAVFGVLRGTMAMLGERQKVLARNIANANTPGFEAKDVDNKSFNRLLANTLQGKGTQSGRLTMQVSEPGHIRRSGSGSGAAKYKIISRPDSETTLNGNSVVLEEQVMRVAETRMRYETAAGLYEKSMGLLRLAISRPGR